MCTEKNKPVTRQSPKKESKEVYRKMEQDLEAMFAGKRKISFYEIFLVLF